MFYNHLSSKSLRKNIAISFLGCSTILFGQKKDSIINQDIEIVRISKHNTNQKISTRNSDYLNHDAGDFLTNVPEVSGRRTAGSYATEPVLRGFKFEQLNLVSDGLMTSIQACPSRMDPASSQINLNMVKEVQIYKGPYQFRFGNAIGGTINFVSINPKFTQKMTLTGRVSTSYETNGNATRNEVLTQLSTKKLVWNLFGSYQRADDYKDGNGNKVPSSFERYNVGSRFAYQWNANNITTAQVMTNQARDVKFATGMMDLLKDNTWLYSLKHDITFNNTALKKLSFNSYFSNVDHLMGTQDKSMLSHVKSKSAGARGEAKFNWGQNQLYTGIDFRHDQEISVPSAPTMQMGMGMGGMNMPMKKTNTWQNGQTNTFGWFNEYQREWGENKITASYRLNFNHANPNDPSDFFLMKYGNLNANQITNSLSLSYSRKLSQNSQATLLVGRGERAASITERYIYFYPLGNDNYSYLGNPHLKTEKNYQADLVYSYKTEKFYFQADAFYSRLYDFISSQIATDIKDPGMGMSKGVRQMVNIDNAYKAGIEATVHWQLTDFLRTEAAVAYTYAENMTQNVPLPETAPLDSRLRLEGNFANFKIGTEMRYVDAQKRTNPLFGEFPTSDFTLFNIDAQTEIFKNASIMLQLKNVFNRAYTEYLNKTTYSSHYTQRFMSPGRNFSLTFSYSF